MNIKKKNALFGKYPSCDMLNNALRFLRDGKTDCAIEEIIFAIEKADGYFHEDIADFVSEAKEKIPSYPCRTCCSPSEQAACCGCQTEREWQKKYGKQA